MNLPAIFDDLASGFGVAFIPENMMFGMLGVVLGTAVGVLPGLGPSGCHRHASAADFRHGAATAFILFGGIYYGAMYGGSTTSILINTPGDSASAISTLEGYPMAEAWPGRRGAGDLGDRLIHRRHLRHVHADAQHVHPGLDRPAVRPAGIFRADAARPDHGCSRRRQVSGAHRRVAVHRPRRCR